MQCSFLLGKNHEEHKSHYFFTLDIHTQICTLCNFFLKDVCVCVMGDAHKRRHPQKPRREHQIPEAELGSCEPPYWLCELNPGPTKEQ